MTGMEMLQEIWREIREDVRSWKVRWRWLTAEEMNDLQPRINPATGIPMLRGSMVDAGGNPYGANLNNLRVFQEKSVVDAGRFHVHCHAEFTSSGNRTLSDIDRECFDWSGSHTPRW